jgi:hypothetical protein
MIRLRTLLAHVIAAALLLQAAAMPAQAAALSRLQAAIDAAICTATPSGQVPAPAHRQPWAGALCLATHGLDQTGLLPAPPTVPALIAWRVSPARPLRLAEAPNAPRAPPVQPRAPPRPA